MLLLALIAALKSYPQKPGSDSSMTINGTISDAVDGTKIFLLTKDHASKTEVDTTILYGGKFTFVRRNAPLGEAVIVTDTLPNLALPNKHRIFYAENATLRFEGSYNKLQSAEITGGTLNKDYDIYNETVNYLERIVLAGYRLEARKTKTGDASRMAIKPKLDSINKLVVEAKLKYVENFPAAYKSPEILRELLMEKSIEPGNAKTFFSNLAPAVKSSPWGSSLMSLLTNLKDIAIGKNLPPLTGKDVLTGKQVVITDYAGKYVLINFWASWCGPCRWDHGQLVKYYRQYKSKGFDVIGVSLDVDKEALINAIKKDNITWNNISDLQGWNSVYARTFGIGAIPFNILVDTTGKIINVNFSASSLGIILSSELK